MKKALAAGAAFVFLAACAGSDGTNENIQYKYPERHGNSQNYEMSPEKLGKEGSIFGEGGIFSFGGDKEGSGGGIGVNSFLWRAALDTVGFMPIASADPFGGVILTDWYSPPETPDERFKLNIFIIGKALKADALKISAFRQAKKGAAWEDAAMPEGTAAKLENAVLTKARDLRIIEREAAKRK